VVTATTRPPVRSRTARWAAASPRIASVAAVVAGAADDGGGAVAAAGQRGPGGVGDGAAGGLHEDHPGQPEVLDRGAVEGAHLVGGDDRLHRRRV
jgi:hypothetical protein